MMMKLLCLFTLLSILVLAEIPSDLVLDLPSQPNLTSKWYSGMLNSTATKQFHYVFIESTGSSSA